MLEIKNESSLFPLSNVSPISKFMRWFLTRISINNKKQHLPCIWAQIDANSFKMKILTVSTECEKKENDVYDVYKSPGSWERMQVNLRPVLFLDCTFSLQNKSLSRLWMADSSKDDISSSTMHYLLSFR